MVIKMEFGEDAENAEPSEEIGLAARLSKKTKTQAKEKGETGCCSLMFFLIFSSGLICMLISMTYNFVDSSY